MYLSERDDMLTRLSEGKHDLAFFPSNYSGPLPHLEPLVGVCPYVHDIQHAYFRECHGHVYPIMVKQASALNEAVKKMPDFTVEYIVVLISGEKRLEPNCNFDDAKRAFVEF